MDSKNQAVKIIKGVWQKTVEVGSDKEFLEDLENLDTVEQLISCLVDYIELDEEKLFSDIRDLSNIEIQEVIGISINDINNQVLQKDNITNIDVKNLTDEELIELLEKLENDPYSMLAAPQNIKEEYYDIDEYLLVEKELKNDMEQYESLENYSALEEELTFISDDNN